MSTIEPHPYLRQSVSLNDLDHILKRRDIVSSSEISFDRSWTPADPLTPAYPPPTRIQAPPGLPSFGSRQATLLRLPQQRSSRASLRLRNWLNSHDESTDHAVASGSASLMASPPLSSPYSPSLVPQTPPNEPTDTRDLLRRTLAAIGMSRMLDPDPLDRATFSPPPHMSTLPQALSSSTSRTGLPPWVYMTNIPGPLARADDGTYMRGTFGPRGSSHGVEQDRSTCFRWLGSPSGWQHIQRHRRRFRRHWLN